MIEPARETEAGKPASPHRDFLSVLLHQLRTPLAATQGTNYLLQRKLAKLSPESQLDWQRVLGLQTQALTALKELLDQVQVLHRINRSADAVARAPTEVAPLIEGIVAEMNRAMPAPRLQLESSLPPGLAAPANAALLDTAVRSLFSNGLKFSPDGSPVRVTLREVEDGWRLAVIDRGAGIPAGEQRRVFEPFFRASNVGSVPGSGLGLVIAQRVAEIHGGRIGFSCDAAEGTQFVLTLPKVAVG